MKDNRTTSTFGVFEKFAEGLFDGDNSESGITSPENRQTVSD